MNNNLLYDIKYKLKNTKTSINQFNLLKNKKIECMLNEKLINIFECNKKNNYNLFIDIVIKYLNDNDLFLDFKTIKINNKLLLLDNSLIINNNLLVSTLINLINSNLIINYNIT